MNITYEMNLSNGPFNLIKLGKKTVEMRLNKKNRDKIEGGDYILFTNEQSEEKLKVLVISVSKFSSFEELYLAYDKEKLGYALDENASPNDMLVYYTKADIKKYGVLAIEIELAKI